MTDRLDAITVFVAVAEHASFAEAARRLNRSPVAVTRAVATLESELRTRLFNRTTRSVALTDDGARYLETCKRLVSAYEDLRGMEAGAQAEPHGVLKLTAPVMFGRLHVLPSLVTFLERYPRLDIAAQFADRVVSLVDEGLDLGVRLGDLPDSSLIAIKVGEVTPGLYASPAYLERHGVPEAPKDLAGHKTISSLTVGAATDRWTLKGRDGTFGIAIKPRLTLSTAEAAADAARAGLGITKLMSYQAEAPSTLGPLVRVLGAYHTAPRPIHIVHPAGRFVPARLRLLIEHLTADLRAAFHRA